LIFLVGCFGNQKQISTYPITPLTNDEPAANASENSTQYQWH